MSGKAEPQQQYVPGIVPDDPGALAQFLSDELPRIGNFFFEQQLIGLQLVLYGSVDAFPLNTTPQPLLNYSDAKALNGGRDESIKPLSGTITVPFDGVYEVIAWVSGSMSSPTQNEQYALRLDVDTVKTVLAVNDVAYNLGNNLAVGATFTRGFTAGQVVYLDMLATASMGTCTLTDTTLELTRRL